MPMSGAARRSASSIWARRTACWSTAAGSSRRRSRTVPRSRSATPPCGSASWPAPAGARGTQEATVSELTLMLIRFAYLAILWIFVLSAISVIRSDMFGARIDSTPRADRRADKQARKQQARSKPTKRPRGAPTQVVVVEGANEGEPALLDHAPILIDRGPDAGIRLDDDYVSTRHARIASSGDQWFVEDLGSTNGTYIGTLRISQPTTITLGTQVRIGKTILELRK